MYLTSGGVLIPLHAQELLLNSSSWVDQVPNFRQEIRQSHYRNDPVKYDLVCLRHQTGEQLLDQHKEL